MSEADYVPSVVKRPFEAAYSLVPEIQPLRRRMMTAVGGGGSGADQQSDSGSAASTVVLSPEEQLDHLKTCAEEMCVQAVIAAYYMNQTFERERRELGVGQKSSNSRGGQRPFSILCCSGISDELMVHDVKPLPQNMRIVRLENPDDREARLPNTMSPVRALQADERQWCIPTTRTDS